MKNIILFLVALVCVTVHAQFKPTPYDTNNDATARAFVSSQIGAQVAGSNYLNAQQVGAQIGGSNYTTSSQIAGSNFLNAVQVGSQIAGSNYIGTNVPYAHIANIDQGTNGSEYHLRDDSGRIAALPVAVFIAQATNSAMILDLMPNGDNTITNAQTPFFTAIDLVNRNLTAAADNTNFYLARIALKTNSVVIGSSAGGTNDAPPVTFQAGTNNARPFAWVFQSTGNIATTTQMWVAASGSLFNANGYNGITNGTAAATGIVGEFMAVTNNFATGTNMTSTLDTNALKLTLTAGDWLVFGHATFASSSSSAKVTQLKASIGLVNQTVNSDGTQVYNWPNVTNNAFTASVSISTPVRVNVTGSTTVFLNANSTFSSGPVVVYGEMEATRIR